MLQFLYAELLWISLCCVFSVYVKCADFKCVSHLEKSGMEAQLGYLFPMAIQ